jgi:alkanesulfonate monooxygenase SsuD/methylene tetrahydromethanopterin reductase-like flavin-dependent oxidoreductase (luciferase family)
MPILLAATAPRMMETAAEVADGLATGSLQSVEFLAEVGAEAKKISPRGDAFTVHCAAFVAADPDADLARQRARQAVVDLFAVKPHPHYERLLRQQGYDEFITTLLARIRERGLPSGVTWTLERETLKASYDALFELAERSATKVGEEVHHG